MKHVGRVGFGWIVALLGWTGCAPAPEPIAQPDYFPLRVGSYAEYLVTETHYTPEGLIQRRTYPRREVLQTSQQLPDGTTRFELGYYSRSATGTWRQDSLAWVWRTPMFTYRTEGGEAIAVLPTTGHDRQQWGALALTSRPERFFELRKNASPMSFDSLRFDRTATVIRQNDSTLLARRRSVEIYAEDVGLVVQERTQLTYCSQPSCLGRGQVALGWSVVSRIRHFGTL
jgi:hypothetical protein